MSLVSVIVPMYGVEAYIRDTIQSVLDQTHSQFELILVDDESPDSSVAICQEFDDSRIRIVHQKNRGLAGARNTGIRHAQGDYLAFLDGDDLWLPTKLEKHVQHLTQNPKVGLSFSPSCLIDQTGQPTGTYLTPQLKEITAEYLFRSNPVGNGSAPVIRRAVLDQVAVQQNRYGKTEAFYFDEDFRRSEDIECWLRICILTQWQLEGIAEPLTLYRVNASSLSASLVKQFESWQQVLNKVNIYAPILVEQWGQISLAYRARLLARKAIRLRNPEMAAYFTQQMLSNAPVILWQEPLRTGRIILGASLLKILPYPLYQFAESLTARFMGNIQRRQMSVSGQ
ncbi:MAG: glucosyl transferase [Leptolyngbya sp.]|nr:MAG: glucosyl transferase [Leptolyngbya sp.]